MMGNGVGRYVRYGDISRKVDVYAFGVVLYELISAKDAIVRSTDGSASGSRGLVYLVIVLLSQQVTFCSRCFIKLLGYLFCVSFYFVTSGDIS